MAIYSGPHICQHFKHTTQKGKGRHLYDLGLKFCKPCGVFMNYDKIYCPCCGSNLRTRPRTMKGKREWRDRNKNIDNKPPAKHAKTKERPPA